MNVHYSLIVALLNVCVCCLGRELKAHGSHINSLLNMQRHKRSKINYNGRGSESRGDVERNSDCSNEYSRHLNSIIITSDSLESGATFISARDATSGSECFDLCCRDQKCDTSILENKDKFRCYLFDCHGKCHFKPHVGYIVWKHLKTRSPSPKKEEEELAHLHSQVADGHDKNSIDHDTDDDSKGDYQSKSESESKGDASDSSSRADDGNGSEESQAHVHSSSAYVPPHTAGLTDYCDSDVSCEDPNASCYDQACQCKQGFYNKKGLCRKRCAHSEFECSALGTSGRGPECIPKSQICDSYMQCADGSDEVNCHDEASRIDSVTRNRNNPQQVSSTLLTGNGVPVLDNNRNNNYNAGNYGNVDSSSSSRQMPDRTQHVSQEDQHFQHEPPVKVNLEDKHSVAEKQEDSSNHNKAQPNSNTQHLQGYDSRENIAENSPHPSVRPINPMLSQPVQSGINDRDQFASKSSSIHDSNPHVQDSLHNPNPNTAFPQPTNIAHKANDKSINNHNQNNDFRGLPPQGFTSNHQDKTPKSYSNSFSGQSAQPRRLGPNQDSGQANPKTSLTQNHNPPSNVPYSESGPLPLNNGRDFNTESDKALPSYKSQSSPGQAQSKSYSAPQMMDTSKISRGRDGVKLSSGRMKNPLPTASKPSSSVVAHTSGSKITESKDQHALAHSSKSKISPSHSKPAVRPNSYQSQSSSLLSSSSSSSSHQQPSRQSWLDGNPYLAYGNSGSGNQRPRQQQEQPSRSSQYYGPSQYFSQYNTDSLDSLSPTLLGDTGQDDFSSQFGGSYMDRQKPLNRMPYPMGGSVGDGSSGRNSGYMGYPDSPYNSQYNPSSRYNYGGEFGGGVGNYQDTDFYSSLRNPNKDYQSPGLYEDEQSDHPVPSSGVIKNKETYPSGNKDGSHSNLQDTKSTSSSDVKGAGVDSPKRIETNSIPSQGSSNNENVKNKTKQSSDVGSGTNSKTNITHSTTKKPHPSVGSSNSKVFVSQEKVIISSSSSEAEGPIIALSLGLTFTIILIGLLACRLRNMKHRLRKGRPLNSNEADYLINGMYL